MGHRFTNATATTRTMLLTHALAHSLARSPNSLTQLTPRLSHLFSADELLVFLKLKNETREYMHHMAPHAWEVADTVMMSRTSVPPPPSPTKTPPPLHDDPTARPHPTARTHAAASLHRLPAAPPIRQMWQRHLHNTEILTPQFQALANHAGVRMDVVLAR